MDVAKADSVRKRPALARLSTTVFSSTQGVQRALPAAVADPSSHRLWKLELMRDSAMLASITTIYEHYGMEYGRDDATGIRQAVAAGHRRWAIRESFNVGDKALAEKRRQQIDAEYRDLLRILGTGNVKSRCFEKRLRAP